MSVPPSTNTHPATRERCGIMDAKDEWFLTELDRTLQCYQTRRRVVSYNIDPDVLTLEDE
jgi:hypothetical protein